MQLSRELPVSLQLTAYTLLLNVNTENIAKLYNVHTGGGKTGCTHGDHEEEVEERETGPMIRDMDKQGMSQTYSS